MTYKKKETVTVVDQSMIATNIFSMWFESERIADCAVPGQFFSMYTGDESKLLPRPISLCEIDKEEKRIRVVYRVTGEGTGTDQFSKLRRGDTVDILGPVGNGFPLEEGKGRQVMIIGGGIGIPPMLELAKQQSISTKIVLGYRDELFLENRFQMEGEVYIATEDGSAGTKGTVLDAIKAHSLSADLIYACGPAPMLRAIQRYAEEEKIVCYVSMEERMACGVGACLACVCQSKEKDAHSNVNNKRVCKDGPVFLSTEVEI